MATVIAMKHPGNGIIKKGIYGFSWTTFFFGGFPAIIRGDIIVGLVVVILSAMTFGVAGVVWAFVYNKKFTLGLIEKGYVFDASENEVALAKESLGIA